MKNSQFLIKFINISMLVIFLSVGIVGLILFSVNSLYERLGIVLLSIGFSLSAFSTLFMFYSQKYLIFKAIDDVNKTDFESQLYNPEFRKDGVINYDESGNIFFISDWLMTRDFKGLLGKNISSLKISYKDKSNPILTVNQRTYKFINNEITNTIHVSDISEITRLEKALKEKQHIVSVFKIDYSSDIKYSSKVYTDLSSNVLNIVQSWATKIGGTLALSQNNEEIIVISEWGTTKKWFKDVGTFFKQFNKLKKDRKKVIISVGVSTSGEAITSLTDDARIRLRDSISKGGNIATINISGDIKYVGLSNISETDNGKIEITFFGDVLKRKIGNAKNVVITSHNNADADALSAIIGLITLSNIYKKKVNFYLESFDSTCKSIYEELGTKFHKYNLSKKELSQSLSNNTLLIVVDTTDKSRIQIQEKNLKKITKDNRILIDHHRVTGEQLEVNIDSIMLDTQSSSTSELVTEILSTEIKGSTEIMRKSGVSNLLALGIYIDTDGLSKNVRSNTLDLCGWLVKSGADVRLLKSYLNISKKEIPQIKTLYKNMKIIKGKYAFSSFPTTTKLDDDIISSFANTLLSFKGIEASFVIAKNKDNKIKVSARSNEKINVQNIMQKIGGGGHFDIAAAVFPGKTKISDVEEKILKILKGL